MSKCKHGMYDARVCAMCKDLPSFEQMKRVFPELTMPIFLIMTPDERVTALKTGVVPR